MGHMSVCMVLHYIPTRYLIEPAVFKVKKALFCARARWTSSYNVQPAALLWTFPICSNSNSHKAHTGHI